MVNIWVNFIDYFSPLEFFEEVSISLTVESRNYRIDKFVKNIDIIFKTIIT